jgi:GWxTD domain-containing protein
MPRARFRLPFVVASLLALHWGQLTPPAHARAQDPKTNGTTTTSTQAQESDPLKRPLSRKQQKANQRRPKGEIDGHHRRWIEDEVPYIITPEERAAWTQLSNDEERDKFIEAFWLRRDPTPDTPENEYKDEHYRRIQYANERFGAGIPGWKTDRGRIYILHGPPDEIESHPSGGTYDRSPQEGGGTTSTFPFERWRYRYLEDVGQEVVIEFVDTCMCGDYHMTMDPTEKDALAHTPMGQPPNSRFMDNSRRFEDLERFVDVTRAPKIRFPDLYEIVTHKINVNLMPFDVLASFIKVTSDTVMMPITIQIKNRDITFANSNGVERGTVNIFGRLTTLSGRVAQTFEDTVQVDVPHELLADATDNSSVYWKALPVYSGHYLLEVVIKDVNGDRAGTWRHSIEVPDYAEDRLATSSLIVADKMEPVASKIVGSSNFVIGDTYLRPRVPSAAGQPAWFRRDQKIAFWMQVYNLALDQKTHRPSATVEYDIVSQATTKSVLRSQQSTAEMGNIADQITLQKTLSAKELQPGVYKLRIKVSDSVSGQTVEPETTFAVE